MRTADRSPSASRTLVSAAIHSGPAGIERRLSHTSHIMPSISVARPSAAPTSQTISAISVRLRRAGGVGTGWSFATSNAAVVLTSGDAGTTSSKEPTHEGENVQAGNARVIAGWPAARTIDAARIQCRSAAGWRLEAIAIARPMASTSDDRTMVSRTNVISIPPLARWRRSRRCD